MKERFEALEHVMFHDHVAVSSDANPVAQKAHALGADALTYLLGQYSIFPRQIVDLLNTARRSLDAWPTVQDALVVNVEEEEGSRSGGVSHYELLKFGMLQEYGVGIEDVAAREATHSFLGICQGALEASDPAYVAGAIYAIEASSIGEIEIVQDLANRLSLIQNGRALPKGSQLHTFLISHLEDFEVGHERDLKEALTPLLGEAEQKRFDLGFREILHAMDAWWHGLNREADLQLIAA